MKLIHFPGLVSSSSSSWTDKPNPVFFTSHVSKAKEEVLSLHYDSEYNDVQVFM